MENRVLNRSALAQTGGEIQKTFDNLTAQMIKDGHFGDEKTVQNIIILLTALIAKAAKDRQEKKHNNNNERDKKKEKRAFTAYKYSNKEKGLLHEAIILSGKPTFLKYDSKAAEPITSIESIEEDTRAIKPPYLENYPYEPCEFENMNEVLSYLERARKETIDSLYKQSKQIASVGSKENLETVNGQTPLLGII